MADYKRMYTTLFNRVTDIIEALQQAQREAEEIYIESPEPEILLLDPGKFPEEPED